ncbi:PolC-type DNA polymerase III [Hazenella sp. IB182357]|uniref:DNA polymerase III PolC-type n=1 Tax=Polycladospora coralii TaxID=2771432 RepID=A0A926NA52_9BACL|nr:PolC-type DNA polymerase III [Polycladospora coralii]MBD1372697.1 PolC-type DNA polymerase III [Polycladospora coralii]MBS7531091.1 PolC-type DNA polymerase III [Polycladospora coralii]
MDGKVAFRNLFRVVELPSEWLETIFRDGEVKKVKVSRKEHAWWIHIHLPQPVEANIWHEFQTKVIAHFGPDIRVYFHFTYQDLQHDVVWEKYKYWIQKQIQENVSASFSAWIGKANWKFEGDQLHLLFPNSVMHELAQQNELETLIHKYYKKITGTSISVHLSTHTQTDTKTQLEAMRQEEEQRLVEQALAEQARAEQMMASEPSPEDVIEKKIGYPINEEPVSISSVQEEERKVVFAGEAFKVEVKELRSGRELLTFNLTDYSDSITCKIFSRDKEDAKVLKSIKDGDWLKVRGSVQFDTFIRDLVLIVKDIEPARSPRHRTDDAAEKRVELHLHTSMSAMDGVIEPKKLLKRVKDWGHQAVAVTDHGVVQAYPEIYEANKKLGLKVLYGMEADIVDDGVSTVMNPVDRGELSEDTYVVFDVETTGLSAVHDTIIEVGAVKMHKGQIIDRFSEFCNPHKKLSPKIVELTKITDDMLVDAPEVDDVIARFLDFIEGSVLVAHNARFDMGFLQEAVRRIQRPPVTHTVLDTLELARTLYPSWKNHRLNTLTKRLDVKLEHHHRAIYDAEATGYVLYKMFEECKEQGMTEITQLNENRNPSDLSRQRPFHAILLVKNQIGMKNLYKLVTMSHLKYFHRNPRIPRSELLKHREGLIIGSACEKGELYEAALNKSPAEAESVARFYDYIEIQPVAINLHLVDKGLVENEERLRAANRLLVKIGEKLNKPVVATGNTHYLDEDDAIYRQIIVHNQIGARPPNVFPEAHFRTTDEMLKEFSYLGSEKAYEVVVTNTHLVKDWVEDEIKPYPEETFAPSLEGAEEELQSICYNTAHEWYGNPLPENVQTRLDRELGSIIKHKYSTLYMISQKIVNKSLEDGYIVGSRGSVGSSFVATLSRISEVNPLPPHYRCGECKHNEFILDGTYESGFDLPDKACPKCGQEKLLKDGHDIPFETFLGFEADKEPDIDLNFDSEYQPRAHSYTEELFGKKYIYRAGSINTVQEKTAYGYVKKYGELKQIEYRRAEVERLARGCEGVKRSTGQHPGGLMVIPQEKEVFDFTPAQHPAGDVKSGVITTHFDYKSISGKILKLDLLGHTAPTIQRMLKQVTGIDPTQVPLGDPKVISIFENTRALGIKPEQINGIKHGTLGIPEFGTYFARGILEDAKPQKFSELVRISGLSHGENVWQGNGQELIQNNVCTISEAICCRDDIMLYLMRMGLPSKTSFTIMEKVRKGKGVTDEEVSLMKENGIPDWYIESCRRIKYMFPRAHAAAYVTSAVRIAWFKVYYPAQFYAALFSTKVGNFDVGAVLKGYDHVTQLIKEINEKGFQATQKEKVFLSILELVQEMYARDIKIRPPHLYQSHANKFLVEDGELIPPFESVAGIGDNVAVNMMKARDDGNYLSIDDFQSRTRASSTVVEVLKGLACFEDLPQSNQMSLF